jgi:hypothetical protein
MSNETAGELLLFVKVSLIYVLYVYVLFESMAFVVYVF